jgi:hypothetical protein
LPSRRSQFRPDVLYDPQKSVVLQFKCGVRPTAMRYLP